MKKHLNLVLMTTFLVVLTTGNVFAGTYSGGTGEPNDPYQIADVNDLLSLAADANDYNKCFIMTADINLDPNLTGGQIFTTALIAANNTSDYFFHGTAFNGMFNGNGYQITRFTIDGGTNSYLGLFGYIGDGGIVQNLNLEDFNCKGTSNHVGSVAGYNNGSLINCYSTGNFSGSQNVGVLVGSNGGTGTIVNCHSAGSVSCSYAGGGLGGFNDWNGKISNSSATGYVAVIYQDAGGLVGFNRGNILKCYTDAEVSCPFLNGGLVGRFLGIISNCYSKGKCSGYQYIGGLVGWNIGNISNCYAGVTVSGSDYVGGLVGSDEYPGGPGITVNSFWDIQTSGQTISAGGEGKTTAEMKRKSTFSNWDFVETWGIEDNQTYPFLKLTYPVGDLDLDKKVDFIDFAIFANHWLEDKGQ